MGHWEKQLERLLSENPVSSRPVSRKHLDPILLYHWEMHVSSDAASRSRLRLTTDTLIWSVRSNTQFFQIEHVMPKSGWSMQPEAKFLPILAEQDTWQANVTGGRGPPIRTCS